MDDKYLVLWSLTVHDYPAWLRAREWGIATEYMRLTLPNNNTYNLSGEFMSKVEGGDSSYEQSWEGEIEIFIRTDFLNLGERFLIWSMEDGILPQ